MKVAAVTSMCPADVQDLIFQQGDKLVDCMKARDQIKTIILNRSSRIAGPVPMDIGLASEEDQGNWNEDEWNVDAVIGQSQCHKCGGYWYFPRECVIRRSHVVSKGGGEDKLFGAGQTRSECGI